MGTTMTTDLTLTTDQLVDRFLAGTRPPARKRLVFAIDATASRQPTWDTAAHVQSQMFLEAGRHGGLEIQLVYFRGYDEMKATGWFSSSTPLVNAMAGVTCKAGHTQINRVLAHVHKQHKEHPIAAMILVGDAFEEPAVHLFESFPSAYCFLEGENLYARQAFGQIADITNGALLTFDGNSPSQLRELLGAVAAYVTDGVAALADHRPEIVRLLTKGATV
jgi:hypothetical protein